ncbi:MAG: FKBP-type peptidyl-prolyl cis-trans isomerase [Acidobacteriaceae bacterium]
MNSTAFLIPSLLVLSAALSTVTGQSAAQTSTGTHAARTHRALPAAKPPLNESPKLPPNIPPAPGEVHTAYALKYIDITSGDGATAEPSQFYTVHYTGWLAADGTKFDSSVDRGEPITFFQGAHRVIPGWDTGFGGMHVGGKRRLFVPYQLAYGEQGRLPVIPPKADLIFDIELVSVSATPPAPPEAPPAPPAGAPEKKDAPQ